MVSPQLVGETPDHAQLQELGAERAPRYFFPYKETVTEQQKNPQTQWW